MAIRFKIKAGLLELNLGLELVWRWTLRKCDNGFLSLKGENDMKFLFTDKKVDLPKSVHGYAEKKVGKLDRFFKEDATASITFSVEKDRNKVELTIRSNGTVFRVSESTSDMLASIDAAVTTLERQIRKNKTRLEKRLRQGAYERALDLEATYFAQDEVEEQEYEILRTKRFPIKPMSKDEAILQMNMVGHSFYAFRDEEAGGAFSVVYRRNDGGYGLIEDEA